MVWRCGGGTPFHENRIQAKHTTTGTKIGVTGTINTNPSHLAVVQWTFLRGPHAMQRPTDPVAAVCNHVSFREAVSSSY